MKKLFIPLISLFAAASLHAASTSVLITNASPMVNLLPLTTSGYAKVLSLSVASSTTNTAYVQLVDSQTNTLTYSVAAYTNYYSYATNLITIWTNYFGATNSFTNLSMVVASNSVAATTPAWPIRATVSVGTNNTVIQTPVSYLFENGIWLTNSGGGPAVVTISYQQ